MDDDNDGYIDVGDFNAALKLIQNLISKSMK